MTTGQRLDILLRNNKITQEELANLSGVSRQTINNIIKGKTSISGDVLIKITKIMTDINLNWLITGYGSMVIDGEVYNEVSEPMSVYHQQPKPNVVVEMHAEIEKFKELLHQKDKTIDALQETVQTQKHLIEELAR